MATGITQPGEFNVKKFFITAHNGFEMDLGAVFESFTIFEDIFSSSITATVQIITTEDLVNVIPIIGQETVYFEVNHPSDNREPIILNMSVHSITEIYKDKNQIRFKLNLITTEQIINYEKRISKYYEGSSTDIAQEVFNELGSSKTLLKQSSSDKQEMIVPNMTPFRALNWLSEKAYQGSAADYMFFETIAGYNFVPLSTLVNSEPQIEYFSRISNVDTSPNFEDKTIIDWSIVSSFDVIDNMMRGMYKSKALTVDILNRKSETLEYNIYDKYFETKKLASQPLFDISGQGRKFNSDPLYLLPENSEITYNHDKNFLNRKSQLQLFNNLKMNLTVFGDTNVHVGSVIDLNIPFQNPTDDNAKNKRYTGNWLVTAVKHVFINTSSYMCEIECVRDSQGEILPQANPDFSGSAFKSRPQ